MKFKHVFTNIFIPLILLVVIIVVGHQTQVQVKKSAQKEVENSLLASVDITESTFTIWANEALHVADISARSDFLQIYFTNRTLLIDDQLERIVETKDVVGVAVQDENGLIIESTHKALKGQKLKKSSLSYWNKVRSSASAVLFRPYIEDFKIDGKNEFMLVTAPVFIAEEGLVGAITLVYDPKIIFNSIFEAARVGSSGETYAFDESGLLISESRFLNDLVKAGLLEEGESAKFKIRLFDPGKNLLESQDKNFKKRKFTRMLESALSEEAGLDVKGYRDYRGVNVVGAWIWLDDYGFGFTSEMDYVEAYSQMVILDQKFKIIYILLTVFLIITLYLNLEGEKLKTKILKTNKSLEAKTRELDSFFDAIDAHAILSKSDPRGKITFINANFEKVSQYSPHELIGQDHRVVNSGHHGKEFFKDMWATIRSKDTWHGQIKNRAKDGSYYWVESTIFPVLDELNEVREYIAVRTNITDVKEKQYELQRAKREAERISNMRANFMANVSHELRTPLNAIIGFLTVLKDETLQPSHKEKFDIVFHAAESLLEIINDVLDFSRLEQGKIELNKKESDLSLMLKQVYDLYNIRTKDRDVVIELKSKFEPKMYLLDLIKVKQIITNLVGNAIKFTSYGVVKLEVEALNKRGTVCDLQIIVSDTGRGIPADKLERIFTPFGQLSADDVLYDSGVGLGLAIVDGYVKLMDGTINVESKLDEGTSFTINLPNIVVSEKNLEVHDTLGKDLIFKEGVKALVVDDNQINLKMMDAYLKKYKIESVLVLSGKEAISKFREDEYDIIFMDQLMPEMKGTEVADLMREKFQKIPPIVSLSASTMEDDLKLFQEKFDEIMTKPIQKNELERVLKRFLSGKVDLG